jgi:hypothetical protein
MRGRIFDTTFASKSVALPKGVSLQDLETMFTLLLAARGVSSEAQMTEHEEQFALGSFCFLHWPGKPPSYLNRARALLSSFGGIASSKRLQSEFQVRISRKFRDADASVVMTIGTGKFNDPTKILRKPRQSMKRHAQKLRLQSQL